MQYEFLKAKFQKDVCSMIPFVQIFKIQNNAVQIFMDAYLFNTIIKVWRENMYTNLRRVVTSGNSENKMAQHRVQNFKIKILSKKW